MAPIAATMASVQQKVVSLSCAHRDPCLLPDAQLLQMVVDEGVRPAVATMLQQRLGGTAGFPPPTRAGVCCGERLPM